MNLSQKYKCSIAGIIALAKTQNYVVDIHQIDDYLPEDLNDDEQMELEELLMEKGIIVRLSSDEELKVIFEFDFEEIEQDDTIDNPVKTYLKQIDKTPLLTPQEEKELGKQIKKGNQEAVKELMEANLRLVVSIAKRYRVSGLNFLDLIQSGNLGLLKAARRFDYSKEKSFTTHATWWIRQAIGRFIHNQAGGIQAHISEDESLLGDKTPNKNSVSPVEVAELKPLHETLCDTLNRISKREEFILNYRFGIIDHYPRTLEAIGQELGVTREGVRQIESIALSKLKKKRESQNKLRDFIDLRQ